MKRYGLWILIGIVLAVGISFTNYTMQYTRTETSVETQPQSEAYARLQELDQQIRKNHEKDGNASTNFRKAAAETERKLWQAELDYILNILKERLPAQEWESLIDEQNQWMIDINRENISVSGELEHQISLAESTRERAYDLTDLYADILSEEEGK